MDGEDGARVDQRVTSLLKMDNQSLVLTRTQLSFLKEITTEVTAECVVYKIEKFPRGDKVFFQAGLLKDLSKYLRSLHLCSTFEDIKHYKGFEECISHFFERFCDSKVLIYWTGKACKVRRWHFVRLKLSLSVEMAEHHEDSESFLDSVMEKIHAKPHHDSSSSSDSDDEKSKKSEKPSVVDSVKGSVNRLFGRQKPVHSLFGGGKSADVLLWRNKQISAGVLVGATVIWLLFECWGYHLLTLICHVLILGITVAFLWSKTCTFINKQPGHIPTITVSEESFQNVASAIRFEINRLFAILHDVASGKDIKTFCLVVAGLWILSVIGTWTSFLTLFYIAFVIAHTVPVLYEKYDDQVDAFVDKAMIELKKHYRTFDAKVLSKIPRGPLKDKKF